MSDRRYRNIILGVLQEIVARFQSTDSVRTVPVFDEAHNQYQILEIGWDESGNRIFQPIIHLELLEGKIWIQENVTDIDLAKELLEWDVDASDIVLGLHSPSLRRFSEYAID
ncbi:fdxN element excision controlling factor protein [Leptolyngbya sp. NIES-2104]|nr:fdxN element excision controlling factor protein [Leptolyngbya sp. NIES-2104]